MFSRCSVGVVPHVDAFLIFVGRKVISTSYSSAILKVPLAFWILEFHFLKKFYTLD